MQIIGRLLRSAHDRLCGTCQCGGVLNIVLALSVMDARGFWKEREPQHAHVDTDNLRTIHAGAFACSTRTFQWRLNDATTT